MASQRNSRGKSRERLDKAKWWFTLEEASGKIFIERNSGRVKFDKNVLGDVQAIQHSLTKTDTLKVSIQIINITTD